MYCYRVTYSVSFHKALEPSISSQIMELHHSKHHATYVAGMNTAASELQQVKYLTRSSWISFVCTSCKAKPALGLRKTIRYTAPLCCDPPWFAITNSERPVSLQAEEAKDVKKIITLEKAINFNGGGELSVIRACINPLTKKRRFEAHEGCLTFKW